MRGLTVFAVVALLAGCTHSVHQVGVATAEDLPETARLRQIEGEAQQSVVLGITDNTDFVDEAHAKLLAQCPRGRIVGVEARHSTSHNFLHFHNHFKLTGLCLTEPRAPAQARTSKPTAKPPAKAPTQAAPSTWGAD